MNNKYLLPLLVAPVALTLSAQHAHADKVDNPVSVRLGLGYLTDRDTRDALGNTHLGGGVGYQFSSKSRVDLDFIQASDNGDDIKSFGLMYLQMFNLDKNKNNQKKLYAGLGLGLFRVSVHAEGNDDSTPVPPPPPVTYRVSSLASFDETDNGFSESKFRLGGKALIGYNFNKNIFTELAYTHVGTVKDADVSNLSLALGVRF